MDQLRNKKGFICDMDGVIYHGNQILPGVKEFIDWLYREDKKFLFLTNNSGKKGVVREKSTHHEVIEKVALYAQSIGFKILNIDFSPIKGPEGNIEYLIHLKKWPNPVEDALLEDLSLVVDRAFETLAK